MFLGRVSEVMSPHSGAATTQRYEISREPILGLKWTLMAVEESAYEATNARTYSSRPIDAPFEITGN